MFPFSKLKDQHMPIFPEQPFTDYNDVAVDTPLIDEPIDVVQGHMQSGLE